MDEKYREFGEGMRYNAPGSRINFNSEQERDRYWDMNEGIESEPEDAQEQEESKEKSILTEKELELYTVAKEKHEKAAEEQREFGFLKPPAVPTIPCRSCHKPVDYNEYLYNNGECSVCIEKPNPGSEFQTIV